MDPPPQAYVVAGHSASEPRSPGDGQSITTVGVGVGLAAGLAVEGVGTRDAGAPARTVSAASYSSAGRTPAKVAARCPSGRTSSTVCAGAPG